MYTVTPETVSKAISVCRKALTKDTVDGVSFALEVLETVLGEAKAEQPSPQPMMIPSQPIQLPPNILDEWVNGEKEDR